MTTEKTTIEIEEPLYNIVLFGINKDGQPFSDVEIVRGTLVSEDGIHLIVHQIDGHADKWCVSEAETGAYIGSDDTEELALQKALNKISSNLPLFHQVKAKTKEILIQHGFTLPINEIPCR